MFGVRRALIVALIMGGFSVVPVSLAAADTPDDNIPDLRTCPAMQLATFRNYYSEQPVAIPCVWALKQNLEVVGFRNVAIGPDDYTSDYDRTTWQDVWSFQTAHAADGLVATGTADLLTLRVLDRVANSNAAFGNNGQNFTPPPAPKPETIYIKEMSETGEMPDDCATSCGKEGGEVLVPELEPAEGP
jgi:hypothetical protein